MTASVGPTPTVTEPAAPSGAAGSVVGAEQGRVHRIFSTRAGGVSAPPYDSLNLGGNVGDDPGLVLANRNRFAESAGLAADRVVWMRQVHGTTVTRVDGRGKPLGRNADSGIGDSGIAAARPELPESDGVLTTEPGVGLAVLVADCVPILAADPVAGVIAAVHAGRRGAADGIALRTLESMVLAGAAPERVEIWLGPAICGVCYEVPAELRDQVEAELPGSAATTGWGTPGLDLRAGVTAQLRSAGVRRVLVDERCTFTDRALFSHRRGAPTGRLAGLIWMSS